VITGRHLRGVRARIPARHRRRDRRVVGAAQVIARCVPPRRCSRRRLRGAAVTSRGNCRDGLPHGNYELRDAKGKRARGRCLQSRQAHGQLHLLVERGRAHRAPAVREDALSGTLALWYSGKSTREPQRKLEAVVLARQAQRRQALVVPERRLRAEYRYDDVNVAPGFGRETEFSGRRMRDADARALALRDAAWTCVRGSLTCNGGAANPRGMRRKRPKGLAFPFEHCR
jgi:hypothetical protein